PRPVRIATRSPGSSSSMRQARYMPASMPALRAFFASGRLRVTVRTWPSRSSRQWSRFMPEALPHTSPGSEHRRDVEILAAPHLRYRGAVRIATWNVNSLKARLEKVTWWLARARPDVLLMQETKLADADAPVDAFRDAGYELAHHGEGRWNGVAIASRSGLDDVVANFGRPLDPARTTDVGDDEPLAEARMIAATCGGVRVVSVYA